MLPNKAKTLIVAMQFRVSYLSRNTEAVYRLYNERETPLCDGNVLHMCTVELFFITPTTRTVTTHQ